MNYQDANDISNTPEIRLWEAVIRRAIADCFEGNVSALQWLYSDSKRKFTDFMILVQYTGTNVIRIRKNLYKHLKEKFLKFGPITCLDDLRTNMLIYTDKKRRKEND